MVRSCWWNDFYKNWEVFSPYTHEWDVTRIVDKRVDPTTKAVMVIFEIGLQPRPYFQTLRDVDPRKVDAAVASLGATKVQKSAVLEKWESGWRVSLIPG